MSDFANINEDAQSGGENFGSQSSNNDDKNDAPQPSESAFPDEDEETITMLDVIEREDKLEEEASAVLGYSDEKNCTYPKGYIPRQALYSCKTCATGPDSQAAICLACSLECHDNHELYELYTKRNYRCDCGNTKFKSDFECKLMDKQQKKVTVNEKNIYNHNFSGRYCICDKSYPPDEHDDSADSNDEMWQCISCEDWFHSKHLSAKDMPSKFEELICGQCVDKLGFVHFYQRLDEPSDDGTKNLDHGSDHSRESQQRGHTSTTDGPKTSVGTEPKFCADCSSKCTETEISDDEKRNACESDTNDSQEENKDPGCSVSSNEKDSADTSTSCILENLKKLYEKESIVSKGGLSRKSAVFWSDCSWRSKLCKCPDCLDMYKAKGCEYLLDEKDTVQYYEAQGKAIAKDCESPYERGMSALNRMNRAAVVEALHGYDEMKADLSSYLKKFAENKKVVREQDIHQFFEQLKSKKRPRFE